ncbi:MAG: hypothetical protein V3S14_05500 [Anaerolineae bacterium]
MKRRKGVRTIWNEKKQRRLRIVVTDEETGERVATATSVETMALVVAPDTLRGDEYRRVVIGDVELVQSLLLDTLEDVMEWSSSGAVLDLSDLLQGLLEEAVEDLPVH